METSSIPTRISTSLKRVLWAGIFSFGLFFLAPAALADTDVSGTISIDTTWTAANSPYMVQNPVVVGAGVTLTVEPGVIVRFSGPTKYLDVYGTVFAQGQLGSEITFTSYRDGSGTPLPGDWGAIRFNPGSVGLFSHAIIRYGGGTCNPGCQFADVYNNGGDVSFDASYLGYGLTNGIYQSAGNVTVTGGTIFDHGSYGIQMTGGTANLAAVSFDANAAVGIFATAGIVSLLDASFSNVGIAGEIRGAVAFTHGGSSYSGSGIGAFRMRGPLTVDRTWNADLPYLLSDTVTVNPGAILTIGAGAVVKAESNGRLDIYNGYLRVNGTQEAPVVFTSLRDDSVSGDTGANGTSSGAGGDWIGLDFQNGANGDLKYAQIRYGGRSGCGTNCKLANLYMTGNSAVTLTDSHLSYSLANGYGILHESGTLALSGTEVDHQDVGLRMTGGTASAHLSSFHDNASYGIYNTSANVVDATNSWWGDASGPRLTLSNPAPVRDRVSSNVTFDPWLGRDATQPIKVAVILADLVEVQHADPSTLTQPCKLSSLDQGRTYASYQAYYEDMFICVNDYYDENTYGTVRFEFEVFDAGGQWYDLPGSQADYAGKSNPVIQALRNDALLAALNDMNGFGPFDVRAIVHPGFTQMTTPTGGMWDVGYSYSASEPRGVHVSSKIGLGVWVHELGHITGPILGYGDGARVIPDLYERGDIRKWDVMADGFRNEGQRNPSSFSTFTRGLLGLLDSESITSGSTTWVTALADKNFGDEFLKLDLGGSRYLLIEARTNSPSHGNWDTSLPENKALVLINGDPEAKRFTIPGNGFLGQLAGIDDGILDPDTQESYLELDSRLVITALGDRETDLGAYQIETSIRELREDEFAVPYLGQILRVNPASVLHDAANNPENVGLGKNDDLLGDYDPGSLAADDPVRITPLGVGLGIALTLGALTGLAALLYAILLLSKRGRVQLALHVKAIRRFIMATAIGTVIALIAAVILGVLFPFGGGNLLWPYTSIELADERGATPDLDLHVRCPDGRHVGMNYVTGEYDIQIADAITNGDNLGAPEWIFFPPIPENAGCIHSVSAHDNQAFLDANPDMASILGSATDSYEIYARYIDPASGIFTSSTLSEQVIAPNEVIVHAAAGTSDIQILPGVSDSAPPVTAASASGTSGLSDWFTSDVIVSLSATDLESGVAETRYSLDGGATYVPYPGQVVLTVDGVRTVTYYSIDGAGNAEAPKTLEVKIDRQAPETAIDAAPADPSASSSATFSFSSPDASALFECSLDAAPFTACTSPLVLTGLATGAHAFSVRAIDPAGNLDATPATYAWTVSPSGPAPATLNVTFLRHTVQSGTQPGSAKAPIQGAAIKAFSKASGMCAFQIGFNPHDFGAILDACAADVQGTTGADGKTALSIPPGDYLLLSRDPQTSVVAGVSSGTLASGQSDDKFLQVIVRADGTSVPAKTTKRVGSLLYIIEPEYVEWSQAQELYPFIFDAPDGDWGLTVTVTPPEGFTVDYPELSTDVSNDYRALQFTLTDVGSCWECGTGIDLEIRHNGKIEHLKRRILTPMTEDFVLSKGLKVKELEEKGVRVTRKKRS